MIAKLADVVILFIMFCFRECGKQEGKFMRVTLSSTPVLIIGFNRQEGEPLPCIFSLLHKTFHDTSITDFVNF